MNGFPYLESAIAEDLGLSRNTIRAMRDESLAAGTDWKQEKGYVRYSDAGREKFLSLLKISSGDASPPVASPGAFEASSAADDVVLQPVAPNPFAAAQPGEERELKVTRKYLNRAIVQAQVGAGSFARVRVKDSRTLKPGMFIRCQWIADDLWKMTQRLPRAHASR